MNRIIIAALVLSAMTANAQVKDGMVGINTDEPRATMHIEPGVSESKGLIIPRITAAQMVSMSNLAHFGADHHAIITYLKEQLPTADRTGKLVDVAAPGYYYYDNTTGVQKWKAFGGAEQDLRMVGTNHLTKEAGVGFNGSNMGTGGFNIGIGAVTYNLANNNTSMSGGGNIALGRLIYTAPNTGTMSGSENTAIGRQLFQMSPGGGSIEGRGNVAMGESIYILSKTNAKNSNTANYNTSIGLNIFGLQNGDLTGGNNIGIGYDSYYVYNGDITNTALKNIALGNSIYRLENSSTSTFSGFKNIGIGTEVYHLSAGSLTGKRNIGMGESVFSIGSGNFSGDDNIGIGNNAMQVTGGIEGKYNIALGYNGMLLGGKLTGTDNIGIGTYTMRANGGIAGSNNIALGYQSMYTNGKIAGTDNIAIGYQVLQPGGSSDIGSYNIGIGNWALYDDLAKGNANIQLGNWNVGTPVTGQLNNVVAIGNEIIGLHTYNTDNNVILLGNNNSTNAPKIGVGTYQPQAKLDVNGGVRVGKEAACTSANEGTIIYDSTTKKFQGCDGTNWVNLN